MKVTEKIYVAGHRGLVGSAILRTLKKNGYKNTGKMFNVSDNCIRKWIKQYEKQINASMT